MKILIIDCLAAGQGRINFTRDFIGAGPRYVAGYIEEISQGLMVTELIRVEDFLEKPKPYIASFSIIGFSAMSMDEPAVIKAFLRWRESVKKKKRLLSIIGGPITNDKTLQTRVPIDIAFMGEAETAIYQLFHHKASELISWIESELILELKFDGIKDILGDIPGISFLQDKKIIRNSKSADCQNLWFSNTTGYPEKIKAYKNFKHSRIFVECLRGCSNFRRTSLTLHKNIGCQESSCQICRGENFSTLLTCPSNVPPGCGFCSTIHEFGSPQSRSIQKIISELQQLIFLGATRIVLGGPDFLDFHRKTIQNGELIDPQNPEPNYYAIEQLISGILKIREIREHHVQIFIENVKASLCTNAALDLIAKLPSSIFSIGCETGSEKFADILGRPSHPSVTMDAVKRAKERGIRVHVYFIHSLPGDNAEYAQETLEFMQKLTQVNIEKITLYKYRELPGSPFYKSQRKYQHFDKKTEKIFNKIKRFSIRYNRQQKNQLVGKKFTVFLTEINKYYPEDAIGWILEGGPKISVKDGKDYLGSFKKVQIIQVLSDKMVLGNIIGNPKN